ncbi:alpha/beta fold hydrolase [Kribbella catacumbae]|uniref:alpha/beta fold hydrolase n=1 Tax=Kribbella catacumbae TaxID=460086 RepID=UPI00037953E4|nr:alpha/beta hydrolase [Kribbella catacumbae]
MYFEDRGQGEAVLLLHGWGGSITDLDRLRQALGEGFRVVAADLPGCGRSEPRTYTADFYNEDAAAFLGLLDRLGIGAAHLVGFSDGGEVALLMAALAPGRALSVVAWGAAGQIVEPAEGFGPLERLLDEPSEQLLPLAAYLAEAYGPERARAMAAGWGGALRDLVAAGGDISLSRAAAITCPVLLVVGSDDPYCPAAAVQELAEAIPRSRFLELENVGHDVHLAAPSVLTGVVLDWLDGH